MTEQEAKTKWCPFQPQARAASEMARAVERLGPQDPTRGGDGGAGLPGHIGEDGHFVYVPPPIDRCIGSACMAWRWVPTTSAGRPIQRMAGRASSCLLASAASQAGHDRQRTRPTVPSTGQSRPPKPAIPLRASLAARSVQPAREAEAPGGKASRHQQRHFLQGGFHPQGEGGDMTRDTRLTSPDTNSAPSVLKDYPSSAAMICRRVGDQSVPRLGHYTRNRQVDPEWPSCL